MLCRGNNLATINWKSFLVPKRIFYSLILLRKFRYLNKNEFSKSFHLKFENPNFTRILRNVDTFNMFKNNYIFSDFNIIVTLHIFYFTTLIFVNIATPWRNDTGELKIVENVNYSVLRKWFQFPCFWACAGYTEWIMDCKETFRMVYGYLLILNVRWNLTMPFQQKRRSFNNRRSFNGG